MDIRKMSKVERAALKAQLEAEERAEESKVQKERKAYVTKKDKFIERNFRLLSKLSGNMLKLKQVIFEESEELDKIQQSMFKVKLDRKSRTLTHSNGRITIKVGNRMNDGWDDKVEIGIEKVREYLSSLATDEKSRRLVDTITRLLARDQKGTLRANKILELKKLANEEKDATFLEGIRIIEESYKPVPTCQFIEVKYRDDNDKEQSLPLSISAMDI